MTQTQQYRALTDVAGTSSESLTSHLKMVHGVISSRYPDIDRVALAAYDADSDLLKTFVSSNHDGARLDQYEVKLADVPSLGVLAQRRQSRIVADIGTAFGASSPHSAWLQEHAFRSSFTVPVFHGETLSGFLFFDSHKANAFDESAASFLEVFASLISQLYSLQTQIVQSMVGTVHVASGLARIRDLETGQHLDRMAAYSRLMARKMAVSHGLSDEFIEYVFLFAPLHDIGKVGIPDRVLLKPGKLDAQEWQIMRRHVDIGEAIVDQIGHDLSLGNSLAFGVMRNIVSGHHERCDGSGYPRGLKKSDIALEARIVAVADVYDALANRRPYKQPWSAEAIAAELESEVRQGRLDPDCVAALMASGPEITDIQRKFADQDLGPSSHDD